MQRIALLSVLGLALAAGSAAANQHWERARSTCQGTTLRVSAQLMDIPWGQSWEAACAKQSGRGVGHGITRRADRCINNAGMWGEWDLQNHASCRPKLEWGELKTVCSGHRQQTVSAKLFNIPSGQDWKSTCQQTSASGKARAHGASGVPQRCVTTATGVYGEWDLQNVESCAQQVPHWGETTDDGCFGPNRQVRSARLWDIAPGQDWVETCRQTEGPNGWGTPDRCAKDALSTGVWGQWYLEDVACTKPLEWGRFKDNGCVRDMKSPDANLGGISAEGFRSYSAVLYNAGGDWLEACRRAPVQGARAHSGHRLDAPHPTACVLADADDALSWATAAILGAATAFVSAPTGPYAVVATGAALALASKAAETGLFEAVEANLNVWGIVWEEDSACGVPNYGEASPSSGYGNSASDRSRRSNDSALEADALEPCPRNAKRADSSLACWCSQRQTRSGQVWGSDVYTADSSVCKAAVHAGRIPAAGGAVRLFLEPGRSQYDASTRHGIATSAWGKWGKSFRFE